MYNIKDFATGIVATAPSPADSGTSFVLTAGEGARMPKTPFVATAHPANEVPTLDNAEKILVTAVSTDTLTIERAKGQTTAKNIAIGWRISAAVFNEHMNVPYLIYRMWMNDNINKDNVAMRDTVLNSANIGVNSTNAFIEINSGSNAAGRAAVHAQGSSFDSQNDRAYWDAPIRGLFTFALRALGTGDADIAALLGGSDNYVYTEKHAGIKVIYSGGTPTVYFTTCDGTTEQTTDITASWTQSLTNNNAITHVLIEHDPGVATALYLSGNPIPVVTHATNIPSGHMSSRQMWSNFWARNTGGTDAKYIYLREAQMHVPMR